MEKKLEFIHVTKKYGEKQALSDFTVVLEPGIYGLHDGAYPRHLRAARTKWSRKIYTDESAHG